MARTPVLAAGGIVLRPAATPLVAVVRLRKRDEWVLPKGKLDDGETPRDAAKREVLEETGHNVTVHEFLGTLVVDSGTRSKVVHYWRMEASGSATRPLMDDVRAVDWLPLDDAVERLSRSHEKTFLENVGPYALAGLIRRTKARPEAEEQAVASKPVAAKPVATDPEMPVHATPADVPEQAHAELAMPITDLERVQAVAVEIKSMLSQAAARASAAGTSETDESGRESSETDGVAERTPSQP